ncbi:tRNA (N6-isopentenyl adenosine(37)-C2)-methylthiotransferase MiaB, partial [Pseudonocardia sp. TMWB2A]|uniref:tRNA (N6-isopentenyl adenosine(37)-C2)-methylthiotransferase MiaB n=1 Tax=Pseudonocardia sp. TMWB2A TaxID=687430 RepID=UPI00307CFAFC
MTDNLNPVRGKLFIETHGCQMNEYDSQKMADVLSASEGLELTTDVNEADVILVNTCSIREKAQEKVFSQLGRWKSLKKGDKPVLIGVGGCVASQEGEAIVKRAPYVDLVFGPQTLHRLPELIQAKRETGLPQVDISFPEIEKFDNLPEPRAEGPTAFVSIMEGCSKYCSFCVVPYTRGTEISRPFEDVLVEVAELAAQGVKEINLLGQNVNAYQGPLPANDDGTVEVADLALLIRAIAEIDGVGRIRFTTSHPLEFSDSLIEAYRDVPKLANYLHLPVQAGSDRVLSAMKRGYTALEFKSKIRKLRAVRPDISVASDFIVGFPGETDADFEKTMKLIQDIGFDQSFSFIYSRRPGTPAADLVDDVSETDKHARLTRLQQHINEHSYAIS